MAAPSACGRGGCRQAVERAEAYIAAEKLLDMQIEVETRTMEVSSQLAALCPLGGGAAACSACQCNWGGPCRQATGLTLLAASRLAGWLCGRGGCGWCAHEPVRL
jgi:hypothetical protein